MSAVDPADETSESSGSVARRWASTAIAAQLVLVAVWFSANGQFRAVETIDTSGYFNVNYNSLADVLGDMRTPGYPVFLALLHFVSSNTDFVVWMHFVAYSLSVFLFYLGLRQLSGDTMRAFIGASTLIYSRVLSGYVSVISTDTLAAAAGVAVCGLILLRLSSPGILVSLLLSLAVMAGWLIRPAYLFLVPFVPIMTWMLFPAFKHRCTAALKSRRWHSATALLLVAAPLLLYSTLRFSVVGRFGIVSFGGFNMLGIAGQFLAGGDIPLLSEDLRNLATAALERRESESLESREFDHLPVTNYMRMESRYDLTIWYVFSDSGSRNSEQNSVELNSQMRRLAQEIVWLHPREYVVWLLKASRQAARKLLWDLADNGFAFILMILSVAVVVLNGCRWSQWDLPGHNSEVLKILTVIAIVYCGMNLAIVIPVCPPLGRFTDSAGVFLTSPLAVWIWDATQRWRSCSLQ